MRLIFASLKKRIIFFVLLLALFFCKTQAVDSLSSLDLINSKEIVVEHLRLHVPKEYRKAWLLAEERSWANWLAEKDGFLGRQLFWDPLNEEATLLISWSNYEIWKNIPQEEIDLVQKKFEKIARDIIGKDKDNFFPLIYEGELLPQ
tara:strand:+ start:8959 stop:9399 length:441 start_codon:yes stop_codon:yes gene_type:complete